MLRVEKKFDKEHKRKRGRGPTVQGREPVKCGGGGGLGEVRSLSKEKNLGKERQ